MDSMVISFGQVSSLQSSKQPSVNTDAISGPREISINRKEAVPLLYGPNSECLKSTWYGQTGNDPKKCSIHMTRDFNDHRLRRRAWDKGFSIKGMECK